MTVQLWAKTVEAARPAAPALNFSIESAAVLEYAATPTLEFKLRVDAGTAAVRSLALHTQVRIMVAERSYDENAIAALRELFGDPAEWGRNLRSLFWLEQSRVVPAFAGSTTIPLHVPCGYDFDVACAKYLHAVRSGDIPLEFLFSGSVFYTDESGALRTVRLPWDREARYALPARLWHELIDRYYPNTAWLRVRRDVFERLDAFRAQQSPPTWDEALERLLGPGPSFLTSAPSGHADPEP